MIAFYGKNSPYSNFYYVEFEYKGYKVTSSEQAFMLEKALLFDESMVKSPETIYFKDGGIAQKCVELFRDEWFELFGASKVHRKR